MVHNEMKRVGQQWTAKIIDYRGIKMFWIALWITISLLWMFFFSFVLFPFSLYTNYGATPALRMVGICLAYFP